MWMLIVESIIFFVCVASLVVNGLWTNMVMSMNALLAVLVAVNYYEPLANWLESQQKSYTYLWDFVALWMVFAVTFLIMRAVTDQISKVRVRFRKPVEMAGGIAFAMIVGGIMVCFTVFTLHTAPLARNFLGGTFQPTPQTVEYDSYIRRFYGWTSRGSLATWKPNPFDPDSSFVYRYGWRRAAFEKQLTVATK